MFLLCLRVALVSSGSRREDLFLKKFKRELSLLNETAEQRYQNLFTEQSQLIKEIPLKYIASYIGITPQALSRIRKRIS